jgi:hypothetical protein
MCLAVCTTHFTLLHLTHSLRTAPHLLHSPCVQVSQLKVKEFDRGDGTYSFQYYFMKPAKILKVTITSQPTSAGVLHVAKSPCVYPKRRH